MSRHSRVPPPHAPRTSYQIQAAINAMHSAAASASETDWRPILALYDQLLAVLPTPIVALNRAVAVGDVERPLSGGSRRVAKRESDIHRRRTP